MTMVRSEPQMEDHAVEQEKLALKSGDLNIFSRDNGAVASTVNKADEEKVVQEGSNSPQKKEGFSCSKLSKRSVCTLVLVAMGMFFNGCIMKFIVPFYMTEGVSRGVSETVIGLILSVFHLTIFIFSPINGHFMAKIGARFMYVSGALVSGICTLIFSLVGSCSTKASFIVCSILCRLMTGLGASAFITAAFAILGQEFPNYTSTVFSMTESVHGLGFMIGPVIGGALYEAAGFIGPFLVVGSMMVWNGLQLYAFLPQPKAIPNTHTGSPFTLLRSLLFIIAMLNIFTGAMGISSLDTLLPVRLQEFNLSPAWIGLGFLTTPAVYALGSPLIGFLTDVKNIPTPLILSGLFLLCIAFLLIGPCPGLTFLPNELWLVVLSTAFIGCGFCCCIAPVMKFMIMGAVEIGFPRHLNTYGLVSGTFYSVLCAGAMTGNFMGGALLDKYGFPFSAMAVALILLFMNVVTIIYFGYRRLAKIRKERDGLMADHKH